MFRRTLIGSVVCSVSLLADSVVLRSGRTVDGTYLGGDSRSVRVATGDRVESFDIGEISQITFGSPNGGSNSSSRTPMRAADSGSGPLTPSQPRRTEILRPENSEVSQRSVGPSSRKEISAGTSIVVRMIDDVDSERDSVGQTFRASIDEPVVVDGETVIPRGADVVVKLIDDKQSGRLTGKTVLTLDLVSVVVNGRAVDIQTQEITQESESRTRQTATRSGGGAALGAIIGAIAGGGRGAAIGAVTGAAAGGAVQVLTKGQKVKVPSETRLTFSIQQPMKL